MDIILVPGLWLHGSSWDAVTPLLQDAGHRTWALTLPGMEGPDVDRSGITLRDHVDAVVAAIDDATSSGDGSPVMVVGHSLGAAIAHAAVDARPERVARAVHVGGFPAGDGETLLNLPAENGEVAMPDWASTEPEMVVDFEPDALARFQAEAIPAPAQVLAGPQRVSDPRRFEVPVTAVCPEYTTEQLRGFVAGGDLPELAQIREVTYVDLPGGHWPQLTQPEALARILIDAAR